MDHEHSESHLSTSVLREAFGDRIGIGRRIASGSFGEVFQGTYNGQKAAIKIVDLGKPVGRGERTITEFIEEYALLKSLNSSHVVEVYEAGQVGDYYYIVMEYGGRKIAARHYSPEKALDVYYQIAWGLRDLHRARIIHRDIKPSNILQEGETIKITDLGLGHKSHELSRRGTAFAGTPSYASPEQFNGEYSPASDVYSLGVLMYELLTGTLPVERGAAQGKSQSTVLLSERGKGKAVPLQDIRDDISPDLARLIHESIDSSPGRRPETEILYYDLERMKRGQPTSWSSRLNRELFDGDIDLEKASEWKDSEDIIPDELTDGVIDVTTRKDYHIDAPHRGGKTRLEYDVEFEGLNERGKTGDLTVIIASEDYGELTPDKIRYGDAFHIKLRGGALYLEYGRLGQRQVKEKVPFPRERVRVIIERFPDKVLFIVGDHRIRIDEQYTSPSANQQIWLSASNIRAQISNLEVYYEKGGKWQDPLLPIERKFSEGDFQAASTLAVDLWHDSDPQGTVYTEALLYHAKSIARIGLEQKDEELVDEALHLFRDVTSSGVEKFSLDAGLEQANILFYRGEYLEALRQLDALFRDTDDEGTVASQAYWLSLTAPREYRMQFRAFRRKASKRSQ